MTEFYRNLKLTRHLYMKLLKFVLLKKIFIDVSVPTVLHVHELCLKHNYMQVSKICIEIASLLLRYLHHL